MNYVQTDRTPQFLYKLYNLNHSWHDQPEPMPTANLTRLEAHMMNRAFASNQANKKYVQVSDKQTN